jgi:hypothetical protein
MLSARKCDAGAELPDFLNCEMFSWSSDGLYFQELESINYQSKAPNGSLALQQVSEHKKY